MTDNMTHEPGLDDSLQRDFRINWEVVAWVVIVALALVTRLWGLGDRAMSHDESLHTFYSWKLYAGQGYEHDPMMHGPLLFHGTALSYFLFGVSDFTARLLSALAGVLLVASPVLVRRWLGRYGAIAAGVMLLVSPTVMYYSRYIRHDILVELFTVLMFISFIRYLNGREGKWIVLGLAAAAGSITSAEMGYITGFVLASFVGIALLIERIGSTRARWLEVVFLAFGIGMLAFAVLANVGRLGGLDVLTEGARPRVAMQLSFLLSGLFLIYGLVSPLISRYLSVPTPPDKEADWELIEVMPVRLALRLEDGASRALKYMLVGGVMLAIGAAIVLASGGGTAGQEPGLMTRLAAVLGSGHVLGLLLLFGGTASVLYGLAARVVIGKADRANLTTLIIGAVPAGVIGSLWYLAGGAHLLAHGTTANPQDLVVTLPVMWLSPLAAVLFGACAVAGIGVLGWLLEVYRERGVAAAIAGASVDAIGVAIVVFAVIYTLLFTTFFTEPDRIDGFLRSIRYWLEQHDVVRGGQPWYYYSLFAPMYEFLPFFLSLAAVAVYALRRDLRFGLGNTTGDNDRPAAAAWAFVPMIIVWGTGNFWIFSWAGEKMPWLIVHLAVPMTFLGGRLCGDMLARVDWEEMRSRGWMLAGLTALLLITLGVFLGLQPFQGQSQESLAQTTSFLLAIPVLLAILWAGWRVASDMTRSQAWIAVGLAVIGVLLALNTRYSLMANFVNDELATEYIVYAHGTPDDKEVYDMLLEMQERHGIDDPLTIGYDNEVSWPFTWYFREDQWNTPPQYLGEKPSGTVNQDVLLVGSPNYGAFEPYLRDRYQSIEFRRMWWPNEGYKNLTPSRILEVLTSPNERRNLLNILLYRRYAKDPMADQSEEKSLTDWYHQANMRMYVRNDLIDEIWPLLQARPDWMPALEGQEHESVSATLDIAATFGNGPNGEPMVEPKGIKLGPDGRLYVVDHGQKRVLVFDSAQSGQAIEEIGRGQFEYNDGTNISPSAWGVGVDDEGAVYVADTWNHQVVKYVDGEAVASVGSYGNPADGNPTVDLDLYFGPRDVAFGPDGNLYVTDTGNKRIVVLDTDLHPLRGFGGDGVELGQFNEPTSLAFDPGTGELYVADLWNYRIQKFDANLSPVADWTVEGWDSQEAAHKAYIAVGPGGIVVASDPSGMRVWVFDSDGNPLATLDLPEDEKGLDLPIGVAIDDELNIYVSSSNSGLVTKYAPIDAVVDAADVEPAADAEDAEGEGAAEGQDADEEGAGAADDEGQDVGSPSEGTGDDADAGAAGGEGDETSGQDEGDAAGASAGPDEGGADTGATSSGQDPGAGAGTGAGSGNDG